MSNTPELSLREALEQSYTYARISFWLNGKPQNAEIPPAQTTLEFLQKTQQLWGTKCSCNEGDCGACTVVVARPHEGTILYEAITSCLYDAAKLHGKHLITVEGLGSPDFLHPIQQAMLDHHSTQCGYCSPGFVMSIFALLAMHPHPSEEQILAALEGNLCRCTGYESILKAARWLADNTSPEQIIPPWCREVEPKLFSFEARPALVEKTGVSLRRCQKYLQPASLDELAAILGSEPEYTIINGGTDIMVQMNIQSRNFPVLVDISGIPGLNLVNFTPEGICIGANVSYSNLFYSGIVRTDLPFLHELVKHIASTQIRNFGTLVGNIANASPIGDSLPLLLVLDAVLLLFSAEGERRLPLREFFLGYRQTALRKGEIIKAVLIPVPDRKGYIKTQKDAKRKAVDISSLVTAVRIEAQDGKISLAELAVGGLAPIPKLSRKFHNALANMELQGLHPEEIAEFTREEFAPLSDVRGSAEYRYKAVHNHVLRYLQEFLEAKLS